MTAALAVEVGTDYACADTGLHPDLMFPDEDLPNDHPDVLDAKAVCQGCAFRDSCLAGHLREPFGVWGGLSKKERDALIKRQQRAPSQSETLFG